MLSIQLWNPSETKQLRLKFKTDKVVAAATHGFPLLQHITWSDTEINGPKGGPWSFTGPKSLVDFATTTRFCKVRSEKEWR